MGAQDVLALAYRPESALGALRDGPASWLDLLGDTKALQPLHSVDEDKPDGSHQIALASVRSQIEDTVFALLGDHHPVEPGQAFGVHLMAQLVLQLNLGLWTELQRHQLTRPMADAMGNVVTGDVEDAPVVQHTSDEDNHLRAFARHVDVGQSEVRIIGAIA
ncbi:MAG TPA: hypothetical protein VIQ29_20515 [Ancylobacter sp.]